MSVQKDRIEVLEVILRHNEAHDIPAVAMFRSYYNFLFYFRGSFIDPVDGTMYDISITFGGDADTIHKYQVYADQGIDIEKVFLDRHLQGYRCVRVTSGGAEVLFHETKRGEK